MELKPFSNIMNFFGQPRLINKTNVTVFPNSCNLHHFLLYAN